MKKNRKFLYRFLLIILLAITALNIYTYGQVKRPHLVNTNGRTFEKASVIKILRDNIQENGSRIGDQIVLLKLNNGNIIKANCPNGMLFGTICHPNMEVVVISSYIGNTAIHTVYSMDRSKPLFLFIGVFLLLLCLIGGRKGIKSSIALIFTFTCFIFLFFPMLMHGVRPIMAAVLTSFIILISTIYLINGPTIKSLVAVAASFCGISTACIAALLFGWSASLSGYNVSNIESLLFIEQNTPINVGELLFAGILFASLGAVMDIAMDISSAVFELSRHNKGMTPYTLFTSGMNVGRDVMGTMSSTLILAFFGSSLGMWVLDYVYALPYLQLINSNAIGIELMQGLSGSFGVILTVPITAVFSAWFPVYIKQWQTKNFFNIKIFSILRHK
ncbi:YibE/F family protein [Pectinatus sottacetonis]|uniref:YibE/F family protein n=1 Tax=Pectinatus sottacetonis TaxID=1002795 RepID=UPI0018C5F218|nr:YibE/F family protein [Pectinatus sottacetonis]